MKQKLTLILLLANLLIQAQEVPTKPAIGDAFPLGSKFTIKLTAIDSINYNFSVIALEQYRKTVHTWNHDALFDAKGQDSTITFVSVLPTPLFLFQPLLVVLRQELV